MIQEPHFDLEFASQLFKALGDEARLRILNLVVRFGEVSIADLELILDFTQTKTSRHLIYMKHSGILNVRKKGQWTFYYFKPKVKEYITNYIQIVANDSILKKDIETYNILYTNRELAAYKMTQRRYF